MRIPCVKTARMVILVLRSPLDHHSITVAYLQAATDRFGGDQRRVLGTVRGTPRGFGRLSTKQWGFNQERWVMNCCAKERWVLKFHEEWEDCKYDLQVSFIAITYYIIYIHVCVWHQISISQSWSCYLWCSIVPGKHGFGWGVWLSFHPGFNREPGSIGASPPQRLCLINDDKCIFTCVFTLNGLQSRKYMSVSIFLSCLGVLFFVGLLHVNNI